MQRLQLEHIIRAASGITGANRFVVIGSQAVLGQFPDAPPELLTSMEADIFTLRSPGDADLIDGSIGEAFHFTKRSATTRMVSTKTPLCFPADGRSGSFRFTMRTHTAARVFALKSMTWQFPNSSPEGKRI